MEDLKKDEIFEPEILERNNTSFPIQLKEALSAVLNSVKNGKELSEIQEYFTYYQLLTYNYFNWMIRARVKENNLIPKGLLISYTMGGGKTAVAVGCALATLQLQEKPKKIIVMLLKSLQDNFVKNIKTILGKLNINNIDDFIKNHFRFVAFNASNMGKQLWAASTDYDDYVIDTNLGEVLQTSLEDSLVIIDEYHLLGRAITNGSKNGHLFYSAIMKTPSVKLLFLTGSIISNDPFEVAVCYNLLAGYELFPIVYTDFYRLFCDTKGKLRPEVRGKFQNRIMGLTSYIGLKELSNVNIGNNADTGNNNETFTPVLRPDKIIKVKMTDYQTGLYLSARKKESEELNYMTNARLPALTKPKSAMTGTYRQKSRQYSNYAPPDEKITDENASSPKFEAILENLKLPGTHIIYSQYVNLGGLGVLQMFLRANGYIAWNSAEQKIKEKSIIADSLIDETKKEETKKEEIKEIKEIKETKETKEETKDKGTKKDKNIEWELAELKLSHEILKIIAPQNSPPDYLRRGKKAFERLLLSSANANYVSNKIEPWALYKSIIKNKIDSPIMADFEEKLKEIGINNSKEIVKEIIELINEKIKSEPDGENINIEILNNKILIQSKNIKEEFDINKKQLEALLKRGTLEDVATAALRYKSTLSGGQQLGLIREHYKDIYELGVRNEGFASPFNSRMVYIEKPDTKFCSLFPDTDSVFGSIGSYFDADLNKSYGWTINPPFIESIMIKTMEHLETALDKATAENPLLAFVLLPAWDDADAIKLLKSNPYLIKLLLLEPEKHLMEEPNGNIFKSKVGNYYAALRSPRDEKLEVKIISVLESVMIKDLEGPVIIADNSTPGGNDNLSPFISEEDNPPLIIQNYDINNKTFHVIRDDRLLAGTKQRAAVIFTRDIINPSIKTLMYTGCYNGFGYIATAYAAAKLGLKCIVLLSLQSVGSHNITPKEKAICSEQVRRAEALGAYIEFYNTWGEMVAAGQEKEKDSSIYWAPLGFKDSKFVEILSEQIKIASNTNIKPNNIWVSGGTAQIAIALAKAYPESQIKIIPSSVEYKFVDKIENSIRDSGLQKQIDVIKKHAPIIRTPYPTIFSYDSLTWDAAVAWGSSGDYVWNVAGVPIAAIIAEKKLANIGNRRSEKADEKDRAILKDFTYRRLFMPPFTEMFQRLRRIAQNPPDEWAIPQISPEGQYLIGYVARRFPEDWNETDGITDHYTEEARIACREPGKVSPAGAWRLIKERNEPIPDSIQERRELVYNHSRGCNLYNTALATYSLARFAPKGCSILDPCAGWGDRLIAAGAAGAKTYTAWDPNSDLQEVYSNIANAMETDIKWTVTCAPFESASSRFKPGGDLVGVFDVVLWNPPFFDKELYQGNETSSTVFNTEISWWNEWHYNAVVASANGLKKGGYFISYSNTYITHELNKILPPLGFKYIGTIGYRQAIEGVSIESSMTRTLDIWTLPSPDNTQKEILDLEGPVIIADNLEEKILIKEDKDYDDYAQTKHKIDPLIDIPKTLGENEENKISKFLADNKGNSTGAKENEENTISNFITGEDKPEKPTNSEALTGVLKGDEVPFKGLRVVLSGLERGQSPLPGDPKIALFTGDEDAETRSAALKNFNSVDNINGELIKVLMISSAGALGVDTNNCRYVHILEPYWVEERIKQVRGRALRLNSHRNLPKEERFVQTFVYMAYPRERKDIDLELQGSTDEEIYNHAIEGYQAIDTWLEPIKETSIECPLMEDRECRLCAPSNQPLFTRDIMRDLRSADPCTEYTKIEIETKEITVKHNDKEVDLFYTIDNKGQVEGYVMDLGLGAHRRLKHNEELYKILEESLNGSKVEKNTAVIQGGATSEVQKQLMQRTIMRPAF